MHSFELTDGHKVDFVLTIGKCKTILSRHGVDLLEAPPADLFETLLLRPLLRMEVMYEMVGDKSGLTQDKFDSEMTGEVAKLAEKALRDELFFFTRNVQPARAIEMEKVLEQTAELLDTTREMIDRVMNNPKTKATLEKIQREAEESALSLLDSLSTKSLDVSELTPTQ